MDLHLPTRSQLRDAAENIIEIDVGYGGELVTGEPFYPGIGCRGGRGVPVSSPHEFHPPSGFASFSPSHRLLAQFAFDLFLVMRTQCAFHELAP
eukprot:scaffold17948_cov37-Cyclotella_meneghiniana.AAC.7